MICMVCIMSDSDSDSDNEYGNYSVNYIFGDLYNHKLWNESESFDNKNDAMDFINQECNIPYRWSLIEASVLEDDDEIWNMGDDEIEEQKQLFETELEVLREKVKQLKEENKQLKLQLEKQTLSNVLDKKIPLGTKSDINEILNSVGYTE